MISIIFLIILVTSHGGLFYVGYLKGRRSISKQQWRFRVAGDGTQIKITSGPKRFVDFNRFFPVNNIEQARLMMELGK